MDTSFPEVLDSTRSAALRCAYAGFHEHFYGSGFFTLADHFDATVLPLDPPADHLAGPLTVHLEVTGNCNLACRHCFAGGTGLRGELLTIDELDRLFADMAAIGSFRVGLTGGEPLLRADLLDIIDTAIGHGLSPCLTTNGLLIDDAIAAELGNRRLAWLNVSLDGATPETHDHVRGRGTFARVLDRLAVLRRYAPFSLAFTVMRHNLHEICACAALARAVGARAAVFRPLYPVGTARFHEDLLPDFEQYNQALAGLATFAPTASADFCDAHPFGPEPRRQTQSVIFAHFGCGAANSVCSVSASGEVSPCSFLGPDFVGGTLRRQSLSEIWNHSPVFRKMRSMTTPPRCERCTEFSVCGGGCRARALALRRSIEAPDPWCAAMAG